MIEVPTNPAWHMAFDALSWAGGAATGIVLYRWRLRELATRIASVADAGYFAALTVGTFAGAYLSGSFTFWSQGVFALAHSVVGALVGGIAGVEIYKLVRGIRMSTGIIFVGPFAVGVAIGRWGCLFAGLPDATFGSPASLPWSVNLGDGVARHPVQIYESMSMLVFAVTFIAALGMRARWATTQGFYWLAIVYGVQRFCWEFFKPYPHLIGPFNHFHLVCAALMVYGIFMLRRTETQPPGAE